jgi:hypothetical protein
MGVDVDNEIVVLFLLLFLPFPLRGVFFSIGFLR